MNKLLSDKISAIVEQLKLYPEIILESNVSKYCYLINGCIRYMGQKLFEENSIQHISLEEYVLCNVIQYSIRDIEGNIGNIAILELFHDQSNTHHIGISVNNYNKTKLMYPKYQDINPTEIINEILGFLNKNTQEHLNWLNNFNFGTAKTQEENQRCFLNITFDITNPETWKPAAQKMKQLIENNPKINNRTQELLDIRPPINTTPPYIDDPEKIKKITHKRIIRK